MQTLLYSVLTEDTTSAANQQANMSTKTARTYPLNHPFSPRYLGAIAQEYCKPRYPNRAHAPALGTNPVITTRNRPAKPVR